LIGGLVLVAAGSGPRGLSANYAILFATTVVMSAGVAVMQPIMPTAVRQWLPHRIGLGTAIYTNGLLVGEVFPTLLTIPYVLPWLSDSWRLALVFRSLPIAIIAAAIYSLRARGARRSAGCAAQVASRLARRLVWRLAA
jgi:CP family cyanate transporter-like MFS transporter